MPPELELRHLRVFVSVVDAGTHTEAARAQGLSQSTVSETLAVLERILGVRLFSRAGAKRGLTAAGTSLAPKARKLLRAAEALQRGLLSASNQARTPFAIATVESVSTHLLPERLATLHTAWPNTKFVVTAAQCTEIRRSVADGSSDLGLVLERESGDAESLVLARTRLVLLGAPKTAPRRLTPDELRRKQLYLSDADGGYHQLLRRYFREQSVPMPKIQALGSIEGVKRGLRAQPNALGLLPLQAVEQELADETLVEWPLRPALPALVLRAILPRRRSPPSPLQQALLSSLRGSLPF